MEWNLCSETAIRPMPQKFHVSLSIYGTSLPRWPAPSRVSHPEDMIDDGPNRDQLYKQWEYDPLLYFGPVSQGMLGQRQIWRAR